MEILTNQYDDPEFIETVRRLISGCTNAGFPKKIFIIKIDNWFDHKWLKFSGKGRIGFGFFGHYLVDMDTALDEFRQDQMTLPPFSPKRVIEEYYFLRDEKGHYSPSPARHASIKETWLRVLGIFISELWIALIQPSLYGSAPSTKLNRRGSIMVYEVNGSSVHAWYAELAKEERWRVLQTKGITPEQVQSLIENESEVRT